MRRIATELSWSGGLPIKMLWHRITVDVPDSILGAAMPIEVRRIHELRHYSCVRTDRVLKRTLRL